MANLKLDSSLPVPSLMISLVI